MIITASGAAMPPPRPDAPPATASSRLAQAVKGVDSVCEPAPRPLERFRDVARFVAALMPREGETGLVDEELREARDPRHRYRQYAQPAHKEWVASGACAKENFFAWMDARPQLDINLARPGQPPRMARLGDAPQVSYLSDAAALKPHLAEVADGVWRRPDGALIDTAGSKGKLDMPGYGILVLDREDRLFVHDAVLGRLHHSSTSAGKPVRAAAMIELREGKARSLVLSSGHYMSDLDDLERLLDFLDGKMDLSKLVVLAPHEDRAELAEVLAPYRQARH
ncbi:hypothetical protein HNO92_001221 [Chromobacterium alkanivorans]|uniref:hypothetical protein n=1 Tax=Chromobacterium alkanivorans TaxID=1071719 RepID=UPI0021693C65|nr:hypothetical protein [Chromobacterium alkanivorans]MCS3803561.1 hypothetical protein [Chromobacterium alkanivorans]MCS3817329.1 hypothetical protein [Chromobacterium alkanivorans]MCS3872927.1 hypothetical protein [Chromobacterium alkanivorans]